VSLSRAQTAHGDFEVLRKTLSRLAVEDVVARTGVTLEPGTALTLYCIERNNGSEPAIDVYQAVFESAGRRYRCPLYRFQPRTQAMESACSLEAPAREAVAI
jgi:hypothetical protein